MYLNAFPLYHIMYTAPCIHTHRIFPFYEEDLKEAELIQ